jgi:hypothetical protein
MASKYASGQFWVDTFDRALATFAQAAVGALVVDKVGLLDIDWQQTASIAGLSAVVSILTSVSFRGEPVKSS